MTRAALALLCLLSLACTPGGITHLCSTTSQAGKVLVLAKESLSLILATEAESQWAVHCIQQTAEERRACRHRIVDELAVQYKARYTTEGQIIQAQRLLASGLEQSGVCK